ncbi:MAG TPA: Gfo/Idh/MocA family oxidoreductase [Sumerlaeia bacterium]|nr:Gfo/Idh/MocA family oxidoreductase [Sumerlaeia bacterium]
MIEKLNGADAGAKKRCVSRRRFISGAGAAAASLTILNAELVRSSEANSKIELGVIGCGGRGAWIADLFQQHGGCQVVAGADYFEDRVKDLGSKFGLEPSRLYTGLSGYRRLLEQKLDAVAIMSPPYFHPEQAAAAVDAGRHVFVAKPVAVDAPGCLTIAESGKKATANRLCFLIDFQTRANPFYREAVQRVHKGDIGVLFSGEAVYHSDRLGIRAEPGTPEARLRNWVFDKALSGDIITEQNIHALDVATWIIDEAPARAYGAGGRKVRTDVGDCWDHFAVIYRFPNDVVLSFNSKQCGKGPSDIGCRVFGAQGTIDTHYGGRVEVRGETSYKGGTTEGIYLEGAVQNIADFHANIMSGRFDNPTVAPSVRSNLTTILGRAAAYGNREATWEEMMRANEKIDGKLDGLKA